jgi:GT2 family glycosyltransferase
VVVVDNASDDGTALLVRERFPWTRLLEGRENRGFAEAANRGARESAGELLLFLNPDARLRPGALAALRQAFQDDPRLGLAGAQLYDPDGPRQPSAWPAPRFSTIAFDALLLRNLAPNSPLHFTEVPEGSGPREVECLSGACLAVRREAFLALDGFDPRFFLYYEDFDLCARARAAGWGVRLVPAAGAVHLLGGSAFQDRAAFLRHYYRGRRAYLRKHHPRPGLLWCVSLCGVAWRAFVYGLAGRRRDARDHALALRELAAG